MEVIRKRGQFEADGQRRRHRQLKKVRPQIASPGCARPARGPGLLCALLYTLQGLARLARPDANLQKVDRRQLVLFGCSFVTSGLEPTFSKQHWRAPGEERKNQVHLAETP
jgi:hypothetical protein